MDFLTNPFNPVALLAAVSRAVERSRTFPASQLQLQVLMERYDSLSSRARSYVVGDSGQLNKHANFEQERLLAGFYDGVFNVATRYVIH